MFFPRIVVQQLMLSKENFLKTHQILLEGFVIGETLQSLL